MRRQYSTGRDNRTGKLWWTLLYSWHSAGSDGSHDFHGCDLFSQIDEMGGAAEIIYLPVPDKPPGSL
jgi:hypothetical protein